MRFRTAGQFLFSSLLVWGGGCASGGKSAETPLAKPATTMVAAVSTQPAVVVFGSSMTVPASEAVPVDLVLAHPDQYAGKVVRVTGIVSDVCKQKGCWLRVAPEPGNGGGDIFVKFVDPPEGRLIPLDAVHHDVTVEGTLIAGQMSQAQARHLRMDAGASQEEIDRINGPQPQLMIRQPAVEIEGIAQPPKAAE